MHLLHTLRNTPWLTRLTLLWFALTLGVAVASPMVHPQHDLLICSSAGMFKVQLDGDGSLRTEQTSEARCPLCVVGAGAPLFSGNPLPTPVQPLTHVQHMLRPDPIAQASAAPPPSRGPPAFL